MDELSGRYNAVETLRSLLLRKGYREDGHACWTKENDPRKLVIEGSRVNGFYVAEVRS